MEIALISHDSKKELMTQFCIAYCGILAKHHLYSTGTTGKYIEDATGLSIERLLPGLQGGLEQIVSRVCYDELDLVLDFRSSEDENPERKEAEWQLNQMCDLHNIPLATNIATAEALIVALERGDFDYREVINPNSEYNRRRKNLY